MRTSIPFRTTIICHIQIAKLSQKSRHETTNRGWKALILQKQKKQPTNQPTHIQIVHIRILPHNTIHSNPTVRHFFDLFWNIVSKQLNPKILLFVLFGLILF